MNRDANLNCHNTVILYTKNCKQKYLMRKTEMKNGEILEKSRVRRISGNLGKTFFLILGCVGLLRRQH